MATIITHKQFPNHKIFKTEIAGRPFSIEVGKTTELANAACFVRYGDTTVHVAVCVSPRPRDGVDFFPLSTCEAHVTMCGPPVPFPGRSKGSVSLKSLLLSTARVSSRRIF